MTELRQKITTLFSLAGAGLVVTLLTPARYAEAASYDPVPVRPEMVVPYPPDVPEEIVVPARPECPSRVIRMRVTACSPQDPQDAEYYARHGYEGGIYGIAAYTKQFPKGTLMRVSGYLDKSYPDKFWSVDSAGGSVIRRSARSGVPHIDVKFRTYYTAQRWGNRWIDVEVIDADDYRAWQRAAAEWDRLYAK
jgi:hypothetical protein